MIILTIDRLNRLNQDLDDLWSDTKFNIDALKIIKEAIEVDTFQVRNEIDLNDEPNYWVG